MKLNEMIPDSVGPSLMYLHEGNSSFQRVRFALSSTLGTLAERWVMAECLGTFEFLADPGPILTA